MIIETLKRIYFYVVGIMLFIEIENEKGGDRCMYVMSFEIVYSYLWSNFFSNICSSGYELSKCFFFVGIFVSLLHGALALGCYFLVVKICFGVLNLVYLFAQIYSLYWRCRENY